MKIKKTIFPLPALILAILFVLTYGLSGCGDKSGTNPSSASVLTTSITNITRTSAKSGGNILDQGTAPITQRGVCWGTYPNPTTASSHTTDGSGTGAFVSNLAGLTRNTLYYIRAYANNSAGTIYGNELSFTTLNDPSTFQYTIENDTQVSDRKLEFDLYIKDIDPAEPFELAAVQGGFLVSKSISSTPVAGLSVSIVPGSSELLNAQQPTSIAIADGSPDYPSQMIIKLASRIPPGCGKGTIVANTGLGTRICRLRITNAVAFSKAQADLTFCFTTYPYAAKVFQYFGNPCLGNQMICDGINCFTGPTYLNITLNP